MERVKLAVLISGRGSNLQSLIDACADQNFPAEISIVISNRPDAYGIERAKQAGLQTQIIDHKTFPDRESFEEALQKSLAESPVDLICLAGFMRVLKEKFVNQWEKRIINIHPSLLPKYPGLHTHQRAIEAGDTSSGCTIHYVTAGMDEGPVILQKSVPLLNGDTPDALAARILEVEHTAYPEAVAIVANGLLKSKKTQTNIPA